MVDDETLFRTMQVAADTGALVMVHAENGDAIDVLVKAGARGRARPSRSTTRSTRPPETEGEATNRAIQLARVAGCAALRRPRLVPGGGRADRARPRDGLERLGRDLHPVLLRRLLVPRAARLRGREVRLHAAAARRRRTRTCSGRPCAATCCRSISTDHCAVPLGRPEDDRPRRLLEDPERRPGHREPAADDPRVRRARRPAHAEPDGRAAGDEPGEALRALPAQGDDRGRLRRRHRRLRSGAARARSPRRRTTRGRTTTSTRATR